MTRKAALAVALAIGMLAAWCAPVAPVAPALGADAASSASVLPVASVLPITPVASTRSVVSITSTASAIAPLPQGARQEALRRAGEVALAGDLEGARRILAAAAAKDPADAALLGALAEAEVKLGLASEASGHLRQALAARPGDAELTLWSAVAAAATPKTAEAESTDSAVAVERTDDAAALLARGLAAAGESETALYDMAESFMRKGAPSVSAALYRKILTVLPIDSQFDIFSRLHLAVYYHKTGRGNLAANMMERVKRPIEYSDVQPLTSQEIDYLAMFFRGASAIEAGDLEEGVKALRNAAAFYPDGIIADGYVVRALDGAGRADEADGVYRIVMGRMADRVNSASEDAGAHGGLASFVEASGRNDAAGLDAAEWALRLSPLRPEYLDIKAALLARAGKYDDALRTIDRAIALTATSRWSEPGVFDEYVWRRLDILERAGKPWPAAMRALPEPSAVQP